MYMWCNYKSVALGNKTVDLSYEIPWFEGWVGTLTKVAEHFNDYFYQFLIHRMWFCFIILSKGLYTASNLAPVNETDICSLL